MNNVLKILKKKESLFLIIYIFLAVVGNALNVLISNGDELWNFFNIYKMNNGFLIYNDLNVIITPLFFYLGKIFLSFADNILAFRIYNCFLMTFFFLFIYKIMKKIGFSRFFSFLIMSAILGFDGFILISGGANYNILALTISLIGIYYLLEEKTRSSSYCAFLQGMIGAIIFLTKQNIGILYTIGFMIYTILQGKILENLKRKLSNIFKYLIIFIIILIVFLIALYFNGNLFGFIDFCFLGIFEFASNNFLVNGTYFSILISLFLLDMFLIFLASKLNKKIENNKKNNIKILISFAIPFILVGYPIFNKMHCILASLLLFILLLYLIFKVILDFKINIKNSKYILRTKNVFLFIVCMCFLIISANNFIEWYKFVFSDESYIKGDSAFFGGIVQENLYNNIKNVTEFIKSSDKQVIIFSPKSALYMTEFKTNNKCFDLPFKGNLGGMREQGLIEEIDKLGNVLILIEKNEDDLIYQESVMVRNYIIDNLEYIGDIENFSIYEKN